MNLTKRLNDGFNLDIFYEDIFLLQETLITLDACVLGLDNQPAN